jgi:hypothetical protein
MKRSKWCGGERGGSLVGKLVSRAQNDPSAPVVTLTSERGVSSTGTS